MASVIRCECENKADEPQGFLRGWYDPVTELPYVAHKPGKCRCTNDLKRYRRDGKLVWLCSCCNMNSDTLA